MTVTCTHAEKGNAHPLLLLSLSVALLFPPVTGWGTDVIADPDITDQVENAFIFDPAVPFDTLDVTTDKGIVTLTGSVSNLLARDRATRLAETVRGVRSVINRIPVEPVPDHSASELAQAVQDALTYDVATDSYEIRVSANDPGEVTLRGTVDSWAERDLSETVAKDVQGVVSVRNEIDVRPAGKRPDAEIRPEIEKRLQWDTLVDDELVDVDVEDGKVLLSGTVGSAAEKRRAEWDAWVSGVQAVDSSALAVAPRARNEKLHNKKYVARSDMEIREAVRDALLHDPRVQPFNIEARAQNGIVTLHGVVDNIKAGKAAERDARNTVGVIGVNSHIKVRPVARLEDEEIAEHVRNALLRNPITDSDAISVRVKSQVVQLDGTVNSYFEKAEAEDLAFRAAGMAEVRNHLAVSYPETVTYDPYVYDWSIYTFPWYAGITITSKSDQEIKTAIENELLWSPFVDREAVTVAVEGGVATLKGSVDSWSEYNAARENAFEGGAVTVINRLEVH